MDATRAALVIGAHEFIDPKFQRLRSPSQDVAALAGVLGDTTIGGFDVRTVVNQPNSVVQQELERFFSGRKPDDLLFLYFSGHGVKDPTGRLYFVTSNTTFDLLRSTGISASFVSDQMEYSRAKRIVVLLDCCYSGAFLKGFRARGDDAVAVEELEGRGRVVITASRATEYAFEADELASENAQPSMFTGAVVGGLATGGADANGDGFVTVDELYDYVYSEVRGKVAGQTPGRWMDVEGDLVVARNPHPPVRAAVLPAELERAITSDFALQRLGAVAELAQWYRSGDPQQRLAAGLPLEQLSHDFDERVKAAAAAALEIPPDTAPVAPAPMPLTAPSEPPAPVPLTAPSEPDRVGKPPAAPSEAPEEAGGADRTERIEAWLASLGGLAVLAAPHFTFLRYDGYSAKAGDWYSLGAFVVFALAACAAWCILRARWRASGHAVLAGLLPVAVADVIYWLGRPGELGAKNPGVGWGLLQLGLVAIATSGVLGAIRLRRAITLAPPRVFDRNDLPATGMIAVALLVGGTVTLGWARLFDLEGDGFFGVAQPVRDLTFRLLVVVALVCGGWRWLQSRRRRRIPLLAAPVVVIGVCIALFLTNDAIYAGSKPGLIDTAFAALAVGAAVVPALATTVVPHQLGATLLAAWTAISAAWLPALLSENQSAPLLIAGLLAAGALSCVMLVLSKRARLASP